MKIKIPKTIKPNRSLTEILKKHSGRDSTGSVSVRHQGGRQKRYYRLIDFRRDLRNVVGKVVQIENDPNRNSFIALIEYPNQVMRYILLPVGLNIGDSITAGENVDIKVGNAMPLKNIPIGIEVHNIELHPGQGAKIIRGAGTFAVILAKDEKQVHIKMPSGEVRKFSENVLATIGRIGNVEHKEEIVGKAGRNILRGIRPTVRGTAQNPRSHPHGGGEGRSGQGMHPKTPWGKSAWGTKTRNKKKWSNKLIIKHRS